MTKKPFTFKTEWVDKSIAKELTEKLLNSIEWEQPIINIYGKNYLVPRLTFFIANKGISYTYSGINHIGKGWPDWLIPFLEKIRIYCNVDFNGCLLNLYRDGDDSMGWHADNEKEIDQSKSIASISLGAKRDFHLKDISTLEKVCFALGNGDLLIMEPDCQLKWIHSLPKRKKVKDLRINLTFRKYLTA